MGIGLAAMLLRLMMAQGHTHALSAATIAPAFVAIGLVAMVSVLFFVTLPANAGASLQSGKPRDVRPLGPRRAAP
jgi:hypothetical protein